jgi:flagellar motility protein MotE (MotC chaperone)
MIGQRHPAEAGSGQRARTLGDRIGALLRTGPRRRRGQGVLMVIVVMFALSGAIRLGLGIDAARGLGGVATAETTAPPDTVAALPDPAQTDGCAPLPADLARALSAREDALAAAELRLAERIAALGLAEEVLTARLADLKTAEERLAETIAQVDGAAEADLARLTSVYESMKPKEAALLFEAMAPEFAAGFLGRMRPDAAAGILAGMSSEAAYRISVILAGRNALAPRE